jgi:hypothetical protein
MKRTFLTTTIILAMSLGVSAQIFSNDDAKMKPDDRTNQAAPLLPLVFDSVNNQNTDAPVGGGAALLITFGAAYAALRRNKKRKE